MIYEDGDYECQGPLCAIDGCGQPAEVEVIVPDKGRRYGDHVCLCWHHMKINEAAKSDETERFGRIFYPFVQPPTGVEVPCSYVELGDYGNEVDVYDLSLDGLDPIEVRRHSLNVQNAVKNRISIESVLHQLSERTKQSIAKEKAVAD